jgi:hypothetical protein
MAAEGRRSACGIGRRVGSSGASSGTSACHRLPATSACSACTLLWSCLLAWRTLEAEALVGVCCSGLRSLYLVLYHGANLSRHARAATTPPPPTMHDAAEGAPLSPSHPSPAHTSTCHTCSCIRHHYHRLAGLISHYSMHCTSHTPLSIPPLPLPLAEARASWLLSTHLHCVRSCKLMTRACDITNLHTYTRTEHTQANTRRHSHTHRNARTESAHGAEVRARWESKSRQRCCSTCAGHVAGAAGWKWRGRQARRNRCCRHTAATSVDRRQTSDSKSFSKPKRGRRERGR